MAHIGLGPVFAWEWLRASRRWQLYAGRSLFVALLFAALCLTWVAEIGWHNYSASMRRNATVGEHIFYAVIGTQLALVLLLAPAATANAICLDKVRGALVHLLVTDLSNLELVLGKLAARLAPLLGMVACSLPLLFLCLHFGGIDPDALIGAFIVIVAVAIVGATLALTVSVWGRRTQEVLLANYLVWGVLLLAAPGWHALSRYWPGLGSPPAGFEYTNPFYLAFAPYIQRMNMPVFNYLVFLAVSLLGSLLLVMVAAWKVRAVTIRQLGEGARVSTKGHRLPGGSQPSGAWELDYNPVYWRERRRRSPGRWARSLWRIYGLFAVLFSLAAIVEYWSGKSATLAAWCNGLQVSIGLLLFGVTTVTTLAEERIAGSLDLLLTTPLPTRAIVWGNWLGSFRAMVRVLMLPTVVVVALGAPTGSWFEIGVFVSLVLSYGAALISLGLLLATWIRRPGRAIALLVTLYVSMTVGWLFVIMEGFSHSGTSTGLTLGSPFFGAGDLTYEIGERHALANDTAWGIGWTAVYSGLAGFLLMLTHTNGFEMRLGRAGVRPETAEAKVIPGR